MFAAGSCSFRHQSLLTLFPSIWWAAVDAPHRKPSGKGREVRVIVLVSLVGVVRCRCDGRAGPVT